VQLRCRQLSEGSSKSSFGTGRVHGAACAAGTSDYPGNSAPVSLLRKQGVASDTGEALSCEERPPASGVPHDPLRRG
jgi:hypothetical protein